MQERNGRLYEKIGDYECWSPPIPKRSEFLNGEVKKVADQKFERTPLPRDFLENFDLSNPEHKALALREAKRRKEGVFLLICGEVTYLTGVHYYYLNYYRYQGKIHQYRDSDRKQFWVWDFCANDANCFGLLLVDKRRGGKSAKGGCITLEHGSRTKNVHNGIQSKTDKDALALFLRGIVEPYRRLPAFFRPKSSSGTRPKKALEFYATATSGKKAQSESGKLNVESELSSKIDFESSIEGAYDGEELGIFFNDEIFKPQKNDPISRHDVVKRSMELNGKIITKEFATSSVGEEGKESKGEEGLEIQRAQDFWRDSDYNNRDEATKRTTSGLYRLFVPAYEGHLVDEYGRSKIEESKRFYQAQRDQVKHNPEKLMRLKRAFPFTIEEALLPSDRDCHFNAAVLGDVLEKINGLQRPPYTRGNLEWIDPKTKSGVKFVRNDTSGRFLFSYIPAFELLNRVEIVGQVKDMYGVRPKLRPLFSSRHGISADPLDKRVVKSARHASEFAAHGYWKYDLANERLRGTKGYWPSRSFVFEYLNRPSPLTIAYEDMAKACILLGCKIFMENQKSRMEDWFNDNGYDLFLKYVDGNEAAGLPSSASVIGQYTELKSEFIDTDLQEDWRRCPFPRTIAQDLQFRSDKTTDYDLSVSAGFALIDMAEFVPIEQEPVDMQSIINAIDPDGIMTGFGHSLGSQKLEHLFSF